MNLSVRIRGTDASTRIAEVQADTAYSPELGGLLSVIMRLLDRNGPIVVYLTAARHGEGTSTIALELAAAARSLSWCNVVLIDASIPATVEGSDIPDPVGLLDIAAGPGDLVFHPRAYEGDVLMQAALMGPNTRLPKIDTVRTLFDRIRKQFTLAIVDGPPILVSQQISSFSAAADFVVLVVAAERTRVADLANARTRLDQLGARVLGVVLNKRQNWVPGFIRRRTRGEPA